MAENAIESLPTELQRHFALMRELDLKSDLLVTSIQDRINQVITHSANTENHGTQTVQKINDDLNKALEQAEETVALATRAFNLIDQHKKRLESEISRYETTLATKVDREGQKAAKRRSHAGKASDDDSRRSHKAGASRNRGRNSRKLLDNASSSVLSVGGKEPTYCLCNRVSFGLMTACDNPTCKIEWYHNVCVGLKEPPKGKWFCPDCRAKLNK